MSSYGGRGPPNIEGMYSLKVDNLTYRTGPDELRRTFEKFGEVGDVYIPRDRHTRESRGFAFVRFFDKRDAEDAMDAMDGYKLDGREIKCQMARYGRPSEPHRRGGRWGGGGGGGGRRGGGGRSRSRSRSPRRRRSRERSYTRSRTRSRSYSRSRSRENRSKSADQNGADASE